jgi:hypothetical protein
VNTTGATVPATEAGRRLDAIIGELGPADWTDPHGAYRASALVLDHITAEEGLLTAAVGDLQESLTGCESYPNMDKLLLWRSGDGALRLRLHVFSPGYTDRPHNHRWNFAARLLGGTYLHAVYGDEQEVLEGAQRGQAPRARHLHQVTAGQGYFLDHSLVHSLHADTTTVCLVLRGPSVKDDYFTWEEASRQLVWATGAARESAQDSATKAMDEHGYARVVAALGKLGL